MSGGRGAKAVGERAGVVELFECFVDLGRTGGIQCVHARGQESVAPTRLIRKVHPGVDAQRVDRTPAHQGLGFTVAGVNGFKPSGAENAL